MVLPVFYGIFAGAAGGVVYAGYFAGGASSTTVDKFAFSDDSRTTLGTGLSASTNELAAMANSGTAGYFGGGRDAADPVATVDKFAFPSDSRSTLGTGLSSDRATLAGMANAEGLA